MIRAIPVILILALAACGGGEPTRYYLIQAVGSQPARLDSSIALDIIDLEIPQYLERSQIASRRAGNQLAFASSHHWGENLRKNLLRVLARNLTNELATAAVGTPNNRLTAAADYRLLVYVERYERGPDGYVQLVTRWQLIDGASRETLANRSSIFTSAQRIGAKDYDGTVAAMSELLGEFAAAVAAEVQSRS